MMVSEPWYVELRCAGSKMCAALSQYLFIFKCITETVVRVVLKWVVGIYFHSFFFLGGWRVVVVGTDDGGCTTTVNIVSIEVVMSTTFVLFFLFLFVF